MKIVILDGYASNPGDLDWKELEALGELTVYDRTAPCDTAARIADADIVLLNKTPLDAETLKSAGHIQMIGILATGYNVVDVQAAKELGIPVCNVPGYSTGAVAQMTLALLLECTQQVGAHNRAVHEGAWERCPDFCFWNIPLTELEGKTMGIVGCGAIGTRVAKAAGALGMKVLFTGRHPRDWDNYVNLEALLKNSDVVSLHCPQTAENLHMINEKTLGLMKRGAILLNTARGGLIDEAAVAAALESGQLSWYGTDVVSKEPVSPENPLLRAPHCIMTPHIAWAPRETRIRLHRIAAENVRAFLAGTPQNVVSP